jgi:hypothetical protein
VEFQNVVEVLSAIFGYFEEVRTERLNRESGLKVWI